MNNFDEDAAPLRIGPRFIKRLRLTFARESTTLDLHQAVTAIRLPFSERDQSLMRYGLMETLSNAVRASVERDAAAPVQLDVACEEDWIVFSVTDGAGGFDVKDLPYDFDEPPDMVNILDDRFDAYRQEHDEKCFGIGLLLARRAADEFRLEFIDQAGQATPWAGPGSVFGTRVILKKKIGERNDD